MGGGFNVFAICAGVACLLALLWSAPPVRAEDAKAAAAFAAQSAPVDAPRFVLTADDIAAWRVEDEKMLYFKMTDEKAAAFRRFTEENLNRKVHLYIGDALISSPVVRAPITGGYGAATLTPAIACGLAAHLPPEREEKAQREETE